MDGSQINGKAGEATGDTRKGDNGQPVGKVSPWVSGNLYQAMCLLLNDLEKQADSKVSAWTPKACTGSERKFYKKKIPWTAGKQTWFWKPELQVAGTWGTLQGRGAHCMPACSHTIHEAFTSACCQRMDTGPGGHPLTLYNSKLTQTPMLFLPKSVRHTSLHTLGVWKPQRSAG